MSYSIRYKPYGKTWQVYHGDNVTNFPAGAKGLEQAEVFALWGLSPTIMVKVEALIQEAEQLDPRGVLAAKVAPRARKAGILAARGKVYPPNPFTDRETTRYLTELGRVKSSIPGSEYSITKINHLKNSTDCSCADFTDAKAPVMNGQRLCKHIIAVTKLMPDEDTPTIEVTSSSLATSLMMAKAARADLDQVIASMERTQANLSRAMVAQMELDTEPYRAPSGDVRVSFQIDFTQISVDLNEAEKALA